MSIKDLTSDMLGEIEEREVLDNPDVDLLQGLSVMASVAGDAKPQEMPSVKEPGELAGNAEAQEMPSVKEPDKVAGNAEAQEMPNVKEPDELAGNAEAQEMSPSDEIQVVPLVKQSDTIVGFPLVSEAEDLVVSPPVFETELPIEFVSETGLSEESLSPVDASNALPILSDEELLKLELAKLKTNDIEVNLVLQKTVNPTMSLTAVYSFNGSAELVGKLNTSQKRGLIKSYLNGMDIGHVEQQLKPFCNWFDKLRFADAILNPEDGNKMWHFRHVLLCPGCVTNASFGTAPQNFYSCLKAFYVNIFHASPSMDHQVARALKEDISILILAVSVPKDTAVPKSLSPYSTSLITVSACSFQIYPDPHQEGMVSVFLSLLGVAHHATAHPPSITSWRRNGMGLFMLIQIIKRCASIKGVTTIEIFLQCSEPSAFHFYSMIGFRQKNKGEKDDGFAMLPQHLQTGLASKTPSAFLHFPKDETMQTDHSPSKVPILMHLHHGGLKHLINGKPVVHDERDGAAGEQVSLSGKPFWCQYPPPKLMGGGRLHYGQKDADNLFVSLPLLRKLFSTPLEPLLPAALLRMKGEMLFARRKKHSEMLGKEWFSTGEVDLMLSILLCDGRYEDIAFVMPVKWNDHLISGNGSFVRYKASLQLQMAHAAMNEEDREALITRILGANTERIEYLQVRQQNLIVNEVIDCNPGLFSKKVLVFPHNEGNTHWSVTFVFNPGHIHQILDDGDLRDNHHLQPCFFRYCSMSPMGKRTVDLDKGIIWFLNLCYSNEMHEANMNSTNAPMKWLSPFGRSFQGPMLGTQSFPSLRLPVFGTLPQQKDGCNCGLGVVTAIAIVLRNVCNEESNRTSFEEQFSNREKLILQEDFDTEEWFIVFDEQFFHPLPTEEKDLILGDYLTMLRKEWFVVFDRMAALHFEVLPKRINKANLVNPLYTVTVNATRLYPDFDTMKKRQAMSKGKLKALAAELAKEKEKDAQNPNTKKQLGQGVTIPFDVTQSPNVTTTDAVIDLLSPVSVPQKLFGSDDLNAVVDLSSPDSKPTSTLIAVKLDEMMVDLAINEDKPEELPVDTDDISKPAQFDETIHTDEDKPVDTDDISKPTQFDETIHTDEEKPVDTDDFSKPTQFDETIHTDEESNITIKKMKDLSLLTPVKIHIKLPKKNKSGNLLKRLKLEDILFEDDENVKAGKKGKRDADNDDYAVLTANAKKQRVSTQSTETIERYFSKYHAGPVMANDTIATIDKAFKKELAAFIANSFKKWNWSSEENHQKTIASWARQAKHKDCSESKRNYIAELIQGMKDERAQFTKELTNEFMFTRPTMVKGLRFVKANNSFYARLVYQEPDEKNPKTMVVGEEELKVEEEWIRSEYADIDIQHIINMHQTDMWTDVPRDVEVRIARHKITRVRYVPPQVRHVLDYDAMAKVINEKDVTVAKRRKKLGFAEMPQKTMEQVSLLDQRIPRHKNAKQDKPSMPSKVSRKQMAEKQDSKHDDKLFYEKEEAKWQKSIIRKAVTYNEKWMGRMENRKETSLEEDFVVMAFGEAFVRELKLSGDVRGYVDVPVGDFKPSHLHEHPNLQILGAPDVQFNQTDGKDLCVSKSLASALFSIGFYEEACAIDNFGEAIMKGAVVDALENVTAHARTILPSWILIRSLPRRFDWKNDLDARHLLLGVLSASDGSCCHAVCIHGGYVYDANETKAIPLCDDALNYCTSTTLVKSTFVDFRRGYIFRYDGQKKAKLTKMTLQV